jgi:hypothetical protein
VILTVRAAFARSAAFHVVSTVVTAARRARIKEYLQGTWIERFSSPPGDDTAPRGIAHCWDATAVSCAALSVHRRTAANHPGCALRVTSAGGPGNKADERPLSQYTPNPIHSRTAVSVRRKPSPMVGNGRHRSTVPRVRQSTG